MRRHAKAPSTGSRTPRGSRLGAVVRGACLCAFVLAAFLGSGASTALAAAPTATIEPAAGVTDTSAEVEGEVNPGAVSTDWKFQYIDDDAYDENVNNSNPGFQGAAEGPSGTTSTTEAVSGELTGLTPKTRYHLRLLVENGEGSDEAVAPTFVTEAAPPAVSAFAAGPVAPESVWINGQINPRNSATTYWFEWGTADCSANPCESIPAEKDAYAGTGIEGKYVTRHLTGLSPETTYHFRLIAENEAGTTEGADQTFTTAGAPPAECPNEALRIEQHSTYLPDCRAYEMVSPPDKNGGDVMTVSAKTQAAADGDAATFSSLVAFGGAAGTSVDTQYLSRRSGAPGTSGWATHPIMPKARSLNLVGIFRSKIPHYVGDFTADLSRGIFYYYPALDPEANSAEVANLYLRTGLLDGAGDSRLLSDAAAPIPPGPGNIVRTDSFSAASSDLSHAIFESQLNLTSDAGGSGNKLYETSDGAVPRLAGRIPPSGQTECDDETESPAACLAAASSQAGLGTHSRQYTQRMISADGSRVLFQSPEGNSGNVYMREDGVRTVQLNVPEPGASGSGSTQAVLSTASTGVDAAGHPVPLRAFFTTAQQLVEEDTNGSEDVYMWSQQADSEGHHLTLISNSSLPHNASYVIGASDDGRYVYFGSSGQLIAGEGATTSTANLYLWHDGALSYIGNLRESDRAARNGPKGRWGFASLAEQSGRVTPDGRHLLFTMYFDAPYNADSAGLAGRGGFPSYDQGTCSGVSGCRTLVVYSADSGRIQCASCDPRGLPGSADSLLGALANAGSSATSWHLSHALSADGRYVFFNTPQSLVPQDTNGYNDAYEYDTQTEQLRLLSSGTEASDSYFLDASPDGSNVFIATHQRLLGWDHDESYDLYDVRVNGGFPEPAPVPAACEGESCRGASPAAPAAAGKGSATLRAAGNPEARPCRAAARRALRFARQAKKLRRKARRAMRHGNKRAAHKLARAARARAKRAHRLRRTAKRCRRARKGGSK